MSFMAVYAIIPVLIAILLIAVLLAVYVYRDARRREMNAPLWTLIVVFAPGFIGLIIYLLVRGSHSDLSCPNCYKPVKSNFAVCPHCGTKLRPSCPNCFTPVEPGWSLCPQCAQPLPQEQPDIHSPVRPKDDRVVQKIFTIALLIPVLLIFLVLIGSFVFSSSGSVMVTGATSTEQFFADPEQPQELKDHILTWLEQESEPGRASALLYTYRDYGVETSFAVVHVPGAQLDSQAGIDRSDGPFGTKATVHMKRTSGQSDSLVFIQIDNSRVNIRVTLDGKKIPCETTEVDFNPTIFPSIPEEESLPAPDTLEVPELIQVIKLEDNQTVGVLSLESDWERQAVLAELDNAPYLDVDHPLYKGYDYKDGFTINVHYQVREGLDFHPEMISCLVMKQNDEYFIVDPDRPDHGRIIRQSDEAFYQLLEGLPF